MRPDRFTTKTAVVTGGGRGLGLAIARGLVQEGANIAIIGRDAVRLQHAAEELSNSGPGKAVAFAADVANERAMMSAAAAILETIGAPNILVNNAGINPWYRKAQNTPMEEWRAVIEVNLTSVFHSCQLFGRPMLEHGRGSIINITSVAGHVGLARSAAYNASKGGIELLTKSLAIDWASENVRVNAVAPGYLATDLTAGLQTNSGLSEKVIGHTPLARFGSVEEVVGACLYLASDESTYVTGQSLRVDGGFTAC